MALIEKLLAQRLSGACKFYDERGRFGFVTGADGVDRFFNANHVVAGQVVATGDTVSFIDGRNSRGPIADRVSRS